MILKPSLVYAEFLEHFLAVIQDENTRNAASMLGGCLRSTPVSNITKNLLCKDSSYHPLSAVIASGCVTDGMIASNAQTKKLQLFFDDTRIQGALIRLGVDCARYTHIQQITLVTCCQEASNRVLTGDFQLFAENAATISNSSSQARVLDIVATLHVKALAGLMAKLQFTSDFKLTEDSVLAIREQQKKFIEMAETNSMIDIPDTELMALCREIPTIVPEQERIQILNELTGLLAKDKELLNPSELLEHEAQLHLLKLHCTLLAITYKDLWQVKAQLISIGTELISGESRFVLPYSVSKIFDIIKSSKIKKTAGQHLLALQEIQGIARSYESDWYTWARNQVSFFASAPSVKEFLATF